MALFPIGNQPSFTFSSPHFLIFLHISPHLYFPNPPADQPTDQQNEQRRNSGE